MSNPEIARDIQNSNYATKLFEPEFTLCHSGSEDIRIWNCEYGFESINAVDKRKCELMKSNQKLTIALFENYKGSPLSFKNQYVKYQLNKQYHVNFNNSRLDNVQ